LGFRRNGSPFRAPGGQGRKSDCLFAGLFRPDADRAFNVADENLAIANLAGFGGAHDGLDGLFFDGVREDDFDFDFGQEINGIFAAAINFGVAFLAAEALTSVTVRPCTPTPARASLTSSSLKGLMMASIFFMGVLFRRRLLATRTGDINNP